MMLIVIFVALALLLDLRNVRDNQPKKLPLFWVLAISSLVWNSLAVSVSWWPDPNDVFTFLFGWVDKLIGGK